MDFYILDDDIAVVKTLKHIISDREIGTVAGYNTDVECAIADIREERPEIIMVDFMMKEMDGITFINEVRRFYPEAAFIMISKLSDKSLVNKAYDAGVEFFVSKPVNVLEIERVAKNIIERIKGEENPIYESAYSRQTQGASFGNSRYSDKENGTAEVL